MKYEVELTVSQVRDLLDDFPDEPEELILALDNAQGEVYSGKAKKAYVQITIKGE